MQGNEMCGGARHRNLILMYISWLTLSLAPTIVAPPEREFVRGQPEMHQAMDNMVTYGSIISKRMGSNDGTDKHEMLTLKTTNLLAETEHMLSSLPVTKERQWLESFVERMRAIAIMLEKTAQNKKQHLPKNLNSVNGTPIPEGFSLQPTWPTMSALPETNPFHKPNRMTPKFPVTSPELSQVLPANEFSTERHSVTKPVVLLNEKEEDELVKELENLHQEFALQVPQQNSKELHQMPVITTSSTPISAENHNKKIANVEKEKEKLKAKLIQEIAEFQRLGGKISSDIMNGLDTENQQEAGVTTNQKPVTEYKLKFPEAHKGDESIKQRLNDFNVENKEISSKNFQNQNLEKNVPFQVGKLLQQLNFSHSFQNIHPHFNPNVHDLPKEMENSFHYMSSQSKEIPYETNLQNVMNDFQKSNPYRNTEQHQAILHSVNQQPGHIPGALKQMLSKSQNKIHNEHLISSNYNEFLMKHGYGPYPYMHNQEHKISTHHPPPMMLSYQTKQPVNPQMDAQLSDEMKRQLRDGKIIVLSDSVVRSNFEPCNDEKDSENKPDKKFTAGNVEK